MFWDPDLGRDLQKVTGAISMFLGSCQDFSTSPLKSPGQVTLSTPFTPPPNPLQPHSGTNQGPLWRLPRGTAFLSLCSICLLPMTDLTVVPHSFCLPLFTYFSLSGECLGVFCFLSPGHLVCSPRYTQFRCAWNRQPLCLHRHCLGTPSCSHAVSYLAFAAL